MKQEMFSDAEITHNETNDFLNLTAYFLVWELFIFTYKIFFKSQIWEGFSRIVKKFHELSKLKNFAFSKGHY